ncbi:glycosyltransferase family 2 protein [Nocardiopsis alba]|uniref:glycosyltransferase family 2 protein n=1 Tax=Nocardiopsis alba TaxID=53437 RepID=UPI00034875D3|nr:glycosyltransferase family A protein [Nocardiopsis alba]
MIAEVWRDALHRRHPGPLLACHLGSGTAGGIDRVRFGRRDTVVDLGRRSVDEVFGPDDPPHPFEQVVLVVGTPTDLRRAVPVVAGPVRAARFTVIVRRAAEHLPPPFPMVPGTGRWTGLLDARIKRVPDAGWSVELLLTRPVSLAEVVTALSHGLAGGRRGTATGPLVAARGRDAGVWRPGDALAGGMDEVDAILDVGTAGAEHDPAEPVTPRLRRWSLEDSRWRALGRPGAVPRPRGGFEVDDVPPLDETMINPTGFVQDTEGRSGRLVSREGRWALVVNGRVRRRLPDDGTVTDADIEAVRDLRTIRVEWGRHSGPLASVRAVAAFAAAGVPLLGDPGPSWASCLGEPLRALMSSVCLKDMRDPLRREEHSVRLRRAALRAHGARARWRRLGEITGVDLPAEPTVSVVLCTRRPHMVPFALGQVARQRGVDVELVLGMHGFDLDAPGVGEAVADHRERGGRVIAYEADPALPLGSILNRAVLRAGGDLVAKMDDDDWYGPDHLADLVLARSYSGADVVGNAAEFVYLEELDMTVRLPLGESERASRRLGGGTLMMDRRVWEETGGFRPIPTSEDTQFLAGVELMGGRLYRTHGCNYVLRRRSGGHTWKVGSGYFLKGTVRAQWPGWRPSALLEPREHELVGGGR